MSYDIILSSYYYYYYECIHKYNAKQDGSVLNIMAQEFFQRTENYELYQLCSLREKVESLLSYQVNDILRIILFVISI
jgi:hypothetical protein